MVYGLGFVPCLPRELFRELPAITKDGHLSSIALIYLVVYFLLWLCRERFYGCLGDWKSSQIWGEIGSVIITSKLSFLSSTMIYTYIITSRVSSEGNVLSPICLGL